jgi:hypothetical protein
VRWLFYNGQLMREGDTADYKFDEQDRVVCFHPDMTDPGAIRIFDVGEVSEARMFEVIFEPRKPNEGAFALVVKAETEAWNREMHARDLESLIGLCVEPTRVPDLEVLEALSDEARAEIEDWCAKTHLAASDNDDIDPGPMPESLKTIIKPPYKGPVDLFGFPESSD